MYKLCALYLYNLYIVFVPYICYYNLANKKAVAPTKNEPPPIKKRKVSRLYHNRRKGTRIMKKLYELIDEYCELVRTCDVIEKEWESNPENAELEKAFDKAYEKESNKYIECANYIVNCTGGKVNFDRAKYLVNVKYEEVKRLALKSCI